MSLPHAILGFLSIQPMTGYDLKACFDTSVANFWPADQAQIYRTLEKLTDDGAIGFRLEIQTDRPNRKVYSLTESGRTELLRWLRQEMPLPVLRDPFLVQVFFGSLLTRAEVLHVLNAQRTLHAEKLRQYRATYIPIDTADMSLDGRMRGLTLEMGIRYEQMYIDWIDWCLAKVGT